jgi:hypothetical protein
MVSQPGRVMRPTYSGAVGVGLPVKLECIFALDVMHKHRTGLIVKEDLLRIGRPSRRKPEGTSFLGQLPGSLLSVTLLDHEFILTRCIGEVGDPLTVGAPSR